MRVSASSLRQIPTVECGFQPLPQKMSGVLLQGRIILTSQDLPTELIEIGSQYPNFWYCQRLSGLEPSEQENLLQKTGLDAIEQNERDLLLRIGTAYQGHPLALRTIYGEILNDFRGNVLIYWDEFGSEIETVEQALELVTQSGKYDGSQDRWKLDNYSITLRRFVKTRLEKTFQRLKQSNYAGYFLLCIASTYRCPVKESWWLEHLEYEEYRSEQQSAALQTLKDRFLIEEVLDERKGRLIGQHNLIRSVAIAHRQTLD